MLLGCLAFLAALQPAHAFESEKHPARSADFWGPMQALSFESKVAANVPKELIDYLRKDNEAQGWPNQPRPAKMPPDFEADVKAAARELPEAVKALINPKLLGIFIVNDLGGSGYTEAVLNAAREPVAGFVVLDQDALMRTANEWATWKESSPFKAETGFSIEASLEEKKHNNRKNAIQYILLHELGHVANINLPLMPPWGRPLNESKVGPAMAYFNLGWKIENENCVSVEDASWSERKNIVYYRDEKLPARMALPIYNRLQKTGFPTLYAVTNPQDDFAEAFANYVHVVMLKKPWTVTIRSGKESLVYRSCWQEERCRKRRELVEGLFQTKIK